MSAGDQPQQQQQAASKVTNIPNLANSVVNLATLRDQSRKELIDVLDTARGRKAIVLDPQISGPLGLVAEVSLLKDHGVEKIYHLNNGKFETECKNIVYMVRPKVKHMRIIAEHIRQHEMDKQKKEYTLCFVPRRTMICERVLEEEGVYGDIMIAEYQLDLIPFDEDVLSLELDTSYRECLLEGDKTSLYYVARALMKIQSTFGIIPNVKGKGVCSKLVYDMLVRMRKEMGAEEPTVTPEIDTLILIDRDVDMITPCCTQLTYEGLIDEVFQIQNSLIEVDPEIAGATNNQALQGKKVKIPLNCNDKVYHEVRDMNFSQIGPFLNRKAKEIDEYYKSRHGASVSQLRDFTKKLSATQQEHTALRIHTNIAEKILNYTKDPAFRRRLDAEQSLLAGTEYDHCVEYLEECINKKEPLTKVLRLLTLLNLTNGGLKPKQLEFFKREVLQTYGFEYIFTLNNFEKLGLLKKQEGKQSFPLIRKNLNLIVEDLNEGTPNDVAYVYSGYAPLSIRLIQQAVRGQWRMQDEVLRSLPGPSFEETQPLPAGIVSQSGGNPVTLVFFIGGVTFTEIAALRYMSLAEQPNRDYLVATTKLIYGDSIIESLVERVEPPRKVYNH